MQRSYLRIKNIAITVSITGYVSLIDKKSYFEKKFKRLFQKKKVETFSKYELTDKKS